MNKLRIIKIMRGIIIRLIELNRLNKESIKLEIKRLILLLEIRIKDDIRNEINERIRWLKRINNLERVNHINDFKLISYNFNKNELIRKTIISKLIITLLENVLTGIRYISKDEYKLKSITNSIIISKPVIKENLSKVEILFYYNLPNYKSYIWYNRILKYIALRKSTKKVINTNINNNDIISKLNMNLNINLFNNILSIRNNNKINSDINKWILINNLNLLNSSKLLINLNKLLKFNLLNKIRSNNIKNDIANLYSNKILINLLNNNTLHNNNKLLLNNIDLILSNLNITIDNNNNIYNKYNNKIIINSINNIINNIYSNKLISNNYIHNNDNNNNLLNTSNLIKSNNILIRNYHTLNNNNNNNNNQIELLELINKIKRNRSIINNKYNKISNNYTNILNNKLNIINLSNKLLDNNININDNNNINNNNKDELKYIVWSMDKLLGNLNKEEGINNKYVDNKLNIILSKYLDNKEVEIKPIHLKYEFNNSDILIKLNRKGVSKRTRTLSRRFRFRLNKRIGLLNEKLILENELRNRNINNIRLENIIWNVSNNIKDLLINSSDIEINNISNDIKDYYSNKIILSNNLKYKNIVGWSLLLKGKIGLRKGKNRSNRILINKGSFKNILLNRGLSKDRLRLNYINNNQIKSYLDKHTNNGKLGINMTLNII